jgi:hypothetical protein
MKCVQVDFQKRTVKSTGLTSTTAWIPVTERLKPGMVVSFVGYPDRKWTVLRVGTIVQDHEQIEQKWGLDLPKSQRTER